MIPVIVPTNANHTFLLPGFSYLFNKYWKDGFISTQMKPVQIISPVMWDGMAHDRIPFNFSISVFGYENTPPEKWSNLLLKYLTHVGRQIPYVIIMLEDYWLYEEVDDRAIFDLMIYLDRHEDVLRIDLTGDRAARLHKFCESFRNFDIIESEKRADYLMSFQAGIWNVEHLCSMLRENESPWDAEIKGSKRVRESNFRVLGTLQNPVRYTPVFRSRKKLYNFKNIRKEDLRKIKKMGWI